MNGNSDLSFLFVINPVAGGKNNPWQDIISNYFTGKPVQPIYYMLEKKTPAEVLKKYIAGTKPDKVIAVGGDGTISLVAVVIAGTGIPLGILPAGSANGMAAELNIPSDPAAALAIIETGSIKKIDVIRINKKDICLHLSDIGLNAHLIKHFEEGKIRGKLGYALVVIKTLWRKRRMQVTIQQKDKQVETEALMIVLANASRYGTGAVVNPDGKPDDGYFEVVIIKRIAFLYLVKVLFRFRRFNPRHVEIFHAKSVKITTRKTMHFQIDGEYKGKVREVDAEILAGYIDVILPGSPQKD